VLGFECLLNESDDVLGSLLLIQLLLLGFEECVNLDHVAEASCLEHVPLNSYLHLELLDVLEQRVEELAGNFAPLCFLLLLLVDDESCVVEHISSS